jgi:hypothetical protein
MEPHVTTSTHEQQIAQRFLRDTAKHQLTILHDDGLYRHISFANPDSSVYRVDLVTWPNHLSVSGDIGGYVFKVYPTADMFDFFRRSQYAGGPNPTYWDEKVTASRHSVTDYSDDLLNRLVAERLEQADANWPGIKADWRERTTDFLAEYDLSNEESARYALRDYEYLPDGATGTPFRFDQDLIWETSFKDYRWSFLWACHVIVAAIREYDRIKAEAPVPEIAATVSGAS